MRANLYSIGLLVTTLAVAVAAPALAQEEPSADAVERLAKLAPRSGPS